MNLASQLIVPDSPNIEPSGELTNPENGSKKQQSSNSNLATPTFFFPQNKREKAFFTALNMSVPINRANYASRTPLINERGYPYHEASLNDWDNSPSKKWHIIFYAWDIGKEKLVRKRVGKFELNKIKDLNERRELATAEIRGLNDVLKKGAYLEGKKTKERPDEIQAYNFHGYTLLDALTYICNYVRDIEQRKKPTIKQYKYTQRVIQRFIHQHDTIDNRFLLRKLSRTFVHQLVKFLRDEEMKNKTINGAVTILHSGVEKLRDLDRTLFKEGNPVKFKKLPVISRTHAAYTTDQLKQFAELIAPKDKQLLLFIYFIYFTLGRPKELRLIKVGHIRTDIDRILMAGENAKEDKEKYVGMSQAFKKIIVDSGILNYPHDYYVFTMQGVPGAIATGANYFSKRFRPYLKELGFKKLNDRYTFYSFKHSGAIQLYLLTKELELVSKQCRHSTLTQTNTYLQDLGVFTNFSGLEKWEGF